MRHLAAAILCMLVVQTGSAQSLSWSAVHQLIRARYGDIPTVTTDQLATHLADSSRQTPLLLDARSEEEYAVSHLPTARRVDPDAARGSQLDSVSTDTPIVVYCSVGYRSARVTKALRDQGFTNVANLKGSIFRWANEGRPVVRGDERVSEVHPYDQVWGQLLADSLHAYVPDPNTK